MKVTTACPHCAHRGDIPSQFEGKKIRCKRCGNTFVADKVQDAVETNELTISDDFRVSLNDLAAIPPAPQPAPVRREIVYIERQAPEPPPASGWGEVLRVAVWCFVIPIGGIICCTGFLVFFPANDPRVQAMDAAKSAVRDRLKAPSSAVFPGVPSVTEVDNRYLVHGEVEAQNVFGVMLRKQYTVLLERNGGRFTVVAVDLD